MRRGVRLVALLAILCGAPVAHAEVNGKVLTQVEVHGESGRAEVFLKGSFDVPTYAVRTRDHGGVLVIDVADASLPPGGIGIDDAGGLVTATAASTTARGVRVELTLREPVSYRARAQADGIHVALEALSQRSAVGESGSPHAAVPGVPEVRRAQIEKRDGRERVVIELTAPAEFRVHPNRERGPARLEIKGARLGRSAPELLDGEGLEVVRGVTLRAEAGRVFVDVDRLPDASGTAIREGSRIVWLFAPPDQRGGRPKSQVLSPAEPTEIDSSQVASFLSGTAEQVKAASKYSGRHIDLDFKDADIHNILRLLAEVGGVNVVTSDDVSGTVTIRMRDVPWDQALDVILQAKSLGMERRGNLIRVAPLTVLEKEREMEIAKQKAKFELAPLETRLIPVSYATAKGVQPRVKEVLSARGTVAVDERTNVLIVRDVIDQLDEIEDLIRTLDTQTPQVLVEARIVEATSNYVRDVGIQWGGDISFNQAFGNQTGLVFPSNVGITGGGYDNQTPTAGLSPIAPRTVTPNFAVNLPAAVGTGSGGALGLTFGSVDGNFNLNLRLSAAESSGAIRIISSPRILTLDNNEATIEQGTQIPYSQVSAQGVQTAFQRAKLGLSVTPHVTSDGSIAMEVQVQRNEPDFTRTGANGQPTLLTREAKTNLLVKDGHTAVIGGIYTRNTGRTVDQVPFFGDIPIIGLIFQRRRMLDQRGELLIFLTPRIVNRDQALISAKK